MSCLFADVEDGGEDRNIVEYLCPLLLGEHLIPLLRACKAHCVLVECFVTDRALDVMMLLLSSFEAYEMPCEWL